MYLLMIIMIIPFETPPPSGRVNAFIDKIKLNLLYKNNKIKSINKFQYKFRRKDYKLRKKKKKKLRNI